VIGGVTVEGETAIDFRTNRAVLVESSYLTIVGSEVDQGRQRDRDQANRKNDQNESNSREAGDRQASADHHRHNVYLVWITPRTEIRRAAARRGDGDRDAQSNERQNQNTADASRNTSAVSFDLLEVGDRVEVRFHPRNTASENQNSMNRRHGRHRTYFGDASAITILSEPGQYDRDRDRTGDRDGDRDSSGNRDTNRDRDRNKQENNRDK